MRDLRDNEKAGFEAAITAAKGQDLRNVMEEMFIAGRDLGESSEEYERAAAVSLPGSNVSSKAQLLKRFEAETADHVMSIFRNDALYRHLRFRSPKSGSDIVTWPGYLAIVGDAGDYIFSGEPDMFSFFRGDIVNPYYWSEKLISSDMRKGTRKFDHDVLRERVKKWYCQLPSVNQSPDMWEAVTYQILSQVSMLRDADDAIELLYKFEFCDIHIDEPDEWDLCSWDNRFVWCCWVIVQVVAQYNVKGRKV